MSDLSPVELMVNGRSHLVEAHPETELVYVLRNDLGMRGVRSGCAIGVCGSCTVLADGQPIRSCITPLSTVVGVDITTPEGLGTPDRPHPVQAAFLAEQAAQCGYCINGIIMSTEGAARAGGSSSPCPPWLDEHLCRCGTHTRVRRAIERVLGDGADGSPETSDGAIAPPVGARVAHDEELSDDAPEGASGGPPHDRVESWIQLLGDGGIGVRTGKVELGQGIRTAMAQIVAAQVGVGLERIRVSPTTTDISPDEAYTSGSNSVDHGGANVAAAAVAFRRLLLQRAATVLETSPAELSLDSDGVVRSSDGAAADLAALAAVGPIAGPIEATDVPDWNAPPLGRPIPRDDLRHKLTGAAAFVHDLALPGMLHARAVLPPSATSRLLDLDVAGVESMPGVVRIVRDDRLVVVVAEREEQAVRAATRLRSSFRWETQAAPAGSANLFDTLRALPSERHVARDLDRLTPAPAHQATYAQPYQAHAAIAPSCAVARSEGGTLRVWTHSQGIHPLRGSLAELIGVEPDTIEVRHMDGPGCYGHNLADDAAAFAAVTAQAVPGPPIRFQFTVEDELTWEPFGPAMLADVEASLDEEGRIRHWRHRSITDVHNTRPRSDASRLIPSWLGETRAEPRWPGPAESGARNAVPIYDIPAVEAVADHVRGPLRTGALRALGAYLNTFASESFMDELAGTAGADPVAFRLAHLTDDRARRVLEAAAERAGWVHRVGPSGRGLGIALSRYKSVKAYVAVAIEASVDPETARVTVERLVIACDAGAIVNPDGLRNQLEGGAVQGLSRALKEEVRFDGNGVTSRDWLSYPVISFAEVPDIEVALVEAAGRPPLGAGEASTGPTAAALANALDDAIGVRLRVLPITPERIRQRLFDLTEEESSRVLLA